MKREDAEAKLAQLRSPDKLMILSGSHGWDGSVTEDGLYEAIRETLGELGDMLDSELDRLEEIATDALWPPDDFPVGFRSSAKVGNRTLTIDIIEDKR